jgi:hypothetical protein
MFAIESHALACNVTELYQPFAALGMWLAVGLCTREHRGMLQWITLPSWILKLNDAGFQIDLSSDALASGLDPLLCAEKILIQNAHWPPAFAVLTMARPSPGVYTAQEREGAASLFDGLAGDLVNSDQIPVV